MNKNIAFYVRKISADEGIFANRELYYISYQQFYLAMQRAGADVRFVSPDSDYKVNGVFSSSKIIHNISEVSNFTEAGEFKADVVFNKGGFEPRDVKVVTDQRLQKILTDKSEMYHQFPEYQPLTILAKDSSELLAAADTMKTEVIVVKAPTGSGGKEVFILNREQMKEFAGNDYPYLIQEFLDTSRGIPGIVNGVHDMRVLVAGGEILGATVRQPAPGKLHSNVSQGGSEMILPVSSIPTELITIVKDIDKRLPDYPRYYSADFGLSQIGWKLFELNDKPGLFRESDGECAKDIMTMVAEYIKGV